MTWKRQAKNISMACHIYGPLKRLHRRLFDEGGLQEFRDIVAFYAPFISRGDLCFDIGSNIGEKTEAFLALGARVVAIEPQPKIFREMRARCGPNRHLTAVNAAVGASLGELPMYVSRRHGASSLNSRWADDIEEVIRVPVTTLDQIIERFGVPRFCKIDVEGYELEVLKGLGRALPCISLEYHLTENDIQKVVGCVDHLSRFGDLAINITLGEVTKFQWSEWIDYRAFRDHFPSRAPRSPTCGYGDLFVANRADFATTRLAGEALTSSAYRGSNSRAVTSC
jgi:FkbM family methyltransferase